MKNEQISLVSEFDEWSQAERAGIGLKARGFDVGNVKIVGARWLTEVDPGGMRTGQQAALLGVRIAVPVFAFLGLIIGSVHAAGGMSDNRILAIIVPIVGMALFGVVVGGGFGSMFGMLERNVDPPAWAEPEYGARLRNGSCLVLFKGDPNTVGKARQAMESFRPISIRIMPPSG